MGIEAAERRSSRSKEVIFLAASETGLRVPRSKASSSLVCTIVLGRAVYPQPNRQKESVRDYTCGL